MNIAESEGERTGIKSSLTMTQEVEREVNGGAMLLVRTNAHASPIDSLDPGSELAVMCNRYQPGERQTITRLFLARELRPFNAGPDTGHPKDPGWIIRLQDGERVLEQMTWGFPVILVGKKGRPLKPKPVNNARFDKLNTFWRRWAHDTAQRCLIPTARYAEVVGEPGRMTGSIRFYRVSS